MTIPPCAKPISYSCTANWPYAPELTALLTKPNAYLDFSDQDLILYPAELAATIRRWIEFVPEKVLFGTDAYPYSTDLGWSESGYIAAKTGRAALGLALTGMLEDGEISRTRALELAYGIAQQRSRVVQAAMSAQRALTRIPDFPPWRAGFSPRGASAPPRWGAFSLQSI